MEAKQKSDLKNQLIGKMTKGGDAARGVPIKKDDTFTFKLDVNLIQPQKSEINGRAVEWDGIMAADGSLLSATQLTRRRNGLNLSGNTVAERIASFCDLFDENDTLKLKVKEVRTRTFVNVDDDNKRSESTSNYLVFEQL